jgi:hypothetical protein
MMKHINQMIKSYIFFAQLCMYYRKKNLIHVAIAIGLDHCDRGGVALATACPVQIGPLCIWTCINFDSFDKNNL